MSLNPSWLNWLMMWFSRQRNSRKHVLYLVFEAQETSQKQEKEEMIKYYSMLSTDDYMVFIGGYKLLDSS